MDEEKEKHFLELARLGAKLPATYNIEDVKAPKDDTPIGLVTK